MNPERWKQVEQLFEAALEVAPGERSGFLETACANDASLRAEVEALLGYASDAPISIAETIGAEARRIADGAMRADLGRRYGAYRITKLLGEGGMGAVYLAERADADFEQEVAIKVLHPSYTTLHAAERFRDERRILAGLEHPGIVRLIDGGHTDDGLPYLVMERVDGVPLTRYAREHDLSVRARVELVERVCAAIQYAHEQRVVHRDLKPSNILVTADGAPKVLDFGIAKLLASESAVQPSTRTGAMLLTPEYASPEQVRGEPVSSTSDVYSLGAVLYELLAERTALVTSKVDALEVLRAICEDDPPLPSTVAPSARRHELRGDLDTVVMKTLHKDPQHRYASAQQLADDLERYRKNLPIHARPATLAYRACKLVRRHRVTFAVAIGTAVVVAASASAYIVARGSGAPLPDICKPAAERLAGVWDPATRDAVAARFAAKHRPDVTATWRIMSGQLDDYAADWSRRWTAACHADDRTSDPLLFAQRLTCLDNAWLILRGIAQGTASVDPVAFSDGYVGSGLLTVLADCDSTPVLRAQAPTPPPEQREEIARLASDAARAILEANTASSGAAPELFDPAVAKVRSVAERLDAMKSPMSTIAWYNLGWLLLPAAARDAARLPELERVVKMAIQRALDLRVDAWLSGAYELEFHVAKLEGDGSGARAAIERWRATLDRTGGGLREVISYDLARFDEDLERGQLDAAREDLARVAVGCERDPDSIFYLHVLAQQRARLELAAGHLEEAEKIQRQIVERATEVWTDDHFVTINARLDLAKTLDAEAKYGAARDAFRAVATSHADLSADDRGQAWAHVLSESVLAMTPGSP